MMKDLIIVGALLCISCSGQVQQPPAQAQPSASAGTTAIETPSGAVYRVGGKITAPKVRSSPDPEYSKEARRQHIQGTVILLITVDERGYAQDIKIQSGLGYGLDEKAIEAIRKWRFHPATKDGRPVAVQVNIVVNFHL